MCEDFSWTDDKDAIVLHEQPATAVYINGDSFIVIRQNNWPDDDSYIVIDPQNAALLACVLDEKAREAISQRWDNPTPAKRLPEPQQQQVKPESGAAAQERPRPQEGASDNPSMAHAKANGKATGDLLEGVANG